MPTNDQIRAGMRESADLKQSALDDKHARILRWLQQEPHTSREVANRFALAQSTATNWCNRWAAEGRLCFRGPAMGRKFWAPRDGEPLVQDPSQPMHTRYRNLTLVGPADRKDEHGKAFLTVRCDCDVKYTMRESDWRARKVGSCRTCSTERSKNGFKPAKRSEPVPYAPRGKR
jgi:hypothetical protein